jgi:integrase
VTNHDLRHSCATLLYSMGVPLATISDIMGHSSTRVTDAIYRHRVPQLQKEAADAMQRALG